MGSRKEKAHSDPVSNVVVTDWTEKIKDEISQNQLVTTTSPDDMLRTTSRLQCHTELETQQTYIANHIEGGILHTESCTEGEAIVAAETDEFYGRDGLVSRPDCKRQQDVSSFATSDDDDDEDDLPVDTLDQRVFGAADSGPLDTMQTATENEDLILENVQNFINMAYLQ